MRFLGTCFAAKRAYEFFNHTYTTYSSEKVFIILSISDDCLGLVMSMDEPYDNYCSPISLLPETASAYKSMMNTSGTGEISTEMTATAMVRA